MSINLWGSEITVLVSSAAPDDTPVWVDISSRVIVPQGQTLETWIGRNTELPAIDPGKAKWLLRNDDDLFTPGNPESDYYPWWKQSRRARVIETLADKQIVLADVYLEIPQNTALVQPTEEDTPKFMTVTVTGIDILGRLRNSRRLQASLTEYVVYQGGTDLVGLWPMTQAAEPFYGHGPHAGALTMTRTSSGTISPMAGVQPNTGLAPTGAEALGARMVTVSNTVGRAFVQTQLPDGFTPSVADGDAVVVVMWFALTADMASNTSAFHEICSFDLNGSGLLSVALERNVTTGYWTLAATNAMTGSIAGGNVGFDALLPFGIYVRPSTNELELWTGSVRQTATLSGSAPTGMELIACDVGFQVDYDLSNLQLYVGTGYGYADFLAQIEQAHAPLDRQLTGERIATALNYAGFPEARRQLNSGVAVMSAATLAGKTAVGLIDEANSTERGRVFAAAGDIHFHDRRTVLNV